MRQRVIHKDKLRFITKIASVPVIGAMAFTTRSYYPTLHYKELREDLYRVVGNESLMMLQYKDRRTLTNIVKLVKEFDVLKIAFKTRFNILIVYCGNSPIAEDLLLRVYKEELWKLFFYTDYSPLPQF